MKLDMHVHSNYSTDGKASPRDVLKRARKVGLGGICITDHNTMKGNAKARKIASEFGLVVVRGMEISSSGGHILGIGIREEVPGGLSPEETFERIRGQGGIAAIPHPYRRWSGLGADAIRALKPDAIEVVNAHSTAGENVMARKLCRSMKLPMTGGSDAHELAGVGKAYTIIRDASGEDDVLKAIRAGRTGAGGQSRSASGALKDRAETVIQWVGRGFRKM